MNDLTLGVLGYGSGWAILAVVVLGLFRGTLVTRREARAIERRADAAEAREAVKDRTIAEFKEAVDLNNHLIQSFLDVAQERQ